MPAAPRGSASGVTFPCSQCDKSFSRKEYMARHFRSKHSKEKPFSCEYCQHGFSRSDLLRRHYKTCSEAKAIGATGPSNDTLQSANTSRQKRRRTASPPQPTVEPSPDTATQEDQRHEEESSPESLLPDPSIPVASTSTNSDSRSPSFPPSLPVPPPLQPQQQSYYPSPPQMNILPQHYQPPPMPNPPNQYGFNPNSYNPYSHHPQLYRSFPPPYPIVPSSHSPPSSSPYPPQQQHPYDNPQLHHYPIPPHHPHPQQHPSNVPTSNSSESVADFLRRQQYPLNQQLNAAPTNSTSAPLTSIAQPVPSRPLATQPPHSQRLEEEGYAHSGVRPGGEGADDSTLSSTDPTNDNNASSSAFRPGTATTDTLAPGLSGTGSFSADEVLASEVLRDLMKSPMSANHHYHMNRPGLSRDGSGSSERTHTIANGGGGQGGGERGGNEHGKEGAGGGIDQNKVSSRKRNHNGDTMQSLIASDHNTDWNLMSNFNEFTSTTTRANTPIEESPAALFLAEWFNKGGVGGISALDLGFPTEPDMYPDWLLNPQSTPFEVGMDDPDKRFEITEQMFHLGYLYPWHVPPIKTLTKYAKRATETLLPSIPVFHSPTVRMQELALHSAFALTVVGGAYEVDGQAFSNDMLVEKRVFLIRGFMEPQKTWEDKFASLQSLLLYQLLGFFHRDEQQRLLSHQFHSSLVFMLKELDLPRKIHGTQLPFPPQDAPTGVIEQAWKDWVKVETWKRVAFIVFLTDLEHSIATNSPQCLALGDMDLDLPASEFAWSAETAYDWHSRHLSCTVHPPTSFLVAVRALMAPDPAPFSQHALVLADLSRLSSFPLLILSRMMSYLEKKAEEALQQIDPFQPILGGLGMPGTREQENRNMLARIRNGREILRRLPGGMARGGGEKWFQDVMPSASGGVPRRSESTDSTSRYSCGSHPSFQSSSGGGGSGKTSSPDTSSCESSLNTPPQPTYNALLREIEEEESYGRDANSYKPYHGDGGARPGETYEQAQERLRLLRESKVEVLQNLIGRDVVVPI